MTKTLNMKKLCKMYVVCPICHHLYKKSECVIKVQGEEVSLKCTFVKFPNHPQRSRQTKCGADLLKKVKVGQKYKFVAKKTFVYYSIIETLQRLVMVPGFLQSCEEWRDRNVPHGCLMDVYDGKLWKEWMRVDDVPFLEIPGNLLFMLNLDWFQPFVHTQYSMGVIYLVIQNLPRRMRFKPENIIIVATIPGPKEPSCSDLNSYLTCMIDDLLKLWNGIQLQTPSSSFHSKIIRAALVYASCDLPATRKLCGFYGVKAKYGCSKCLKCFPSVSSFNINYSGFERDEWQPRDLTTHISIVKQAKNASSQSEQANVEKKIGARYSELLRLPYFDIIRCHLVDPMHNLYLGTSKRMIKIWKERNMITESGFHDIQCQIDKINPPSTIGRLPHKIATQFAGFTAEQWLLWTTLYSPLVLRGILPENNYTHWCIFSRACSLLSFPHINVSDVEEADKLLVTFCKGFQELYGEEECTPNLHMHCHLKTCIMDVGPLHSFWCFSFERYNGILEKMQKSWQGPEIQLAQKFSALQMLSSINLPQTIPPELQECFMKMKHDRLVIPDFTFDGLTIFNYEQNFSCLPPEVIAEKLPFHQPVTPGKEKFLTEQKRNLLAEMYSTIYGQGVTHIPLRYEEFREVKVFEEVYTSAKSKSTRSSVIVAVWPSPLGILSSRRPTRDDIRVGAINFFLVHCPVIASHDQSNPNVETTITKPHVIAEIEWYQDHPRKFSFGNGIVLSATVSQPYSCASFMPISRIVSRCATVNKTVQMDYGEDSVCIAIPLRQQHVLLNQT